MKRPASWSGRANKVSENTFGPLVKRLTPTEEPDHLDWAGDADWARLQQEPLRARSLLRLAAVALLVLVVWAAFAKIDEVTRGEARVVPTSQVQIIQSVDGGVVEALLVKEGQIVEAGQLLLRVDPTRFVSNLMESQASQTRLAGQGAAVGGAHARHAVQPAKPNWCAMRLTWWSRSVACMNRAGPKSAPRPPSTKANWCSGSKS